jgi:hypothetical protein
MRTPRVEVSPNFFFQAPNVKYKITLGPKCAYSNNVRFSIRARLKRHNSRIEVDIKNSTLNYR